MLFGVHTFGVGQYLVCDSNPTVRFPVSVMPLARTVSSGTLRPPFGTFGVNHSSPRETEPALAPMRGAHVGRS